MHLARGYSSTATSLMSVAAEGAVQSALNSRIIHYHNQKLARKCEWECDGE